MSPEQLWNATLGELELELSKANFTTWFEDTFIMRLSSETITVGVPNAFTKTWLENKYHETIIKALRRISDSDIRVIDYEVSTRQAGEVAVEAEEEQAAPEVESISQYISQPTHTVTVSSTAGSQSKAGPIDDDALGLNPQYTFDHFVVGKKSELAHAACLAVSERPGTVYNPLFIYGGVGLGKTHLMQAVGHAVLNRDPSKKLLYVTCETFTNEFIKLVGEGRADEFKDKYRSVDILMVDDIQFLAGKEGTQEAFFHTFNHLHQRNKQILLTSDRPPRAIPTLEGRLVSRFEGGMIVDVNLPDLETRIAIVKRKSTDKNFPISPEIAQFIASNVQNNVRELEGALNRVIGFHQLNNTKPTLESVKALLASFSHTPKRGAVTTKKILTTVSQYFEVEQKDLTGNSRKKELVNPRQIAMFLMREEVHASYPNIGQELGGRDHTTAMHACQKITRLVDEDEKTQSDINMIKQRLYN
ncbi:MAG: chromosomal replication initiator protein DnaA [Candidatus Kerfeldbacteria bacterium]